MKLNQKNTPIFDAVRKYVDQGVVPFHVPGHKQGRGLTEFTDFVGDNVMSIDLTCFEGTDNICNPIDTIRDAERLAAQAFGADHAHFLVNGTTSGIQSMIMTVCKPGDKIILPRNAHKSAISGIVLASARPVYVQPEICHEHGITFGVTPEKIRRALLLNPDAKAVFLVYPTYYGFVYDLAKIVEIAHGFGVPVIVDEAHGAHLPFHQELPPCAMELGADMSAVSTHKMGGSLTQSSLLLVRKGLIDPKRVKAVLNLTQTTSPSYILLSSIDVARKQLAVHGEEMLTKTLHLARKLRTELAKLPGITVAGEELIGRPGCGGMDLTKVAVNTRGLGISGLELEKILRRQYQIQVELAELSTALFLVSIGDDESTINRLIEVMSTIAYARAAQQQPYPEVRLPEIPEIAVSPQQAFLSETYRIPLEDAVDAISAEMIMAYPPGVPILCPGERITQEIVDYVSILKKEECSLQGTEDSEMNYIKVLKRSNAKAEAAGMTG